MSTMGVKTTLFFALLTLLRLQVSAGPLSSVEIENAFVATSLFEVSANSTCGGDPPTIFAYDDQELNCSVGDHSVDFSLDSNPNTWWQSNNTDDPVSLHFFLEPALYLVVPGIQLVIRHSVPSFYHVIIYGKNPDYIQEMAHVRNLSLCENLTIPCHVFMMENNVIDLAFNTTDQPIAEISLTFSGGNFQSLDPKLSYYALVEVTIFAQVAEGFYVRSLDDIKVEGESGIIQSTSRSVLRSSDLSLFPEFSGRGFALLNYSQLENVMAQWLFPSLPMSTEYQIAFVYSSQDRRNRRRPVTVMQGDMNFNARVTFLANCFACTAFLSAADSDQVNEPANITLTQSMVTITVSLSAVDISLDVIVAIPQQFFNPTSLYDPARFITTCDIISGEFLDVFCLTSALQLSAEFFLSTYDCLCQPGNSSCQVNGGQCNCTPASVGFSTPIGRQCNLCPFYSHHTINGCNACTCPSPLDECSLETGACLTCPPLAFGSTCESCISNSYRNNDTCTLCECNPIGSMSCNQTSGQCTCREGVGGDTCNRCDSAHFNFTSSGCRSCNCGLGSINGSCDDVGQCYCEEGVSGLKCTACSDGFYSLSSQGCLPCVCSNVTNQCSLLSNSTSDDPQELCDCPFPFTGLSCESCVAGYYEIYGLCEPCNCNGRADRCTDGDGQCIDCTDNSTGLNCELCVEGMYDEDDSTNLSCQSCPCSTITSFNTSCNADINGQPSCYCLPGHLPPLCNDCSSGYFGSPPSSRCTDCSCNGNIDPNIPGSCDSTTGQCIICINNATGAECELCQLGYFGDATIQNCQLCDCYDQGSNDSQCNEISGQCSCLKGVGGRTCDQCQEGFWNFTSGKGCQQCQCSEASINSICNQLTGQCACKNGVGELDCSSCLDGFYNFTDRGCSECNCGLGSSDGDCSDDGTCYCLPGVTGAKCDQCLPFHSLLSSSGCQLCSGCEGLLVLQLSGTEDIVTSIGLNLSLFITLMNTDVSDYETALRNLMSKKSSLFLSLNSIEIRLNILNTTALNSVMKHSLATSEQVQDSLERATMIQPNAIAIREHVLDVHRTMQEIFITTGSANLFIVSISNLIIDQASVAMEIRANVSMLDSHVLTNLLNVTLHQEITSMLYKSRENVDTLFELVVGQQNQSSAVDTKYRLQDLHVSNLALQSNSTSVLLDYLYSQCGSSSKLSIPDVISILDLILIANDSLTSSDMTIARTQSLLILAEGDIRALIQAINSIPESAFEEMSGSGDLISGSGVSLGESLPPSIIGNDIISIDDGINSIRNSFDQLSELFRFHVEEVHTVAGITTVLVAAQNLNSTLTPALELGNIGTLVILDYSYVLNKLAQVRNLSNETEVILQYAMYQSAFIVENNFQTSNFADVSDQLTSSVNNQSSNTRQLLQTSDLSRMKDAIARRNVSRLDDIATQLAVDVNGLSRATNLVALDAVPALIQIDNEINVVQNVSFEVSSSFSIILNATLFTSATTAEVRSIISSAAVMLNNVSSSVMSSQDSIANRTSLFSTANEAAEINQLNLGRLNSSLTRLQLRVKQALDAAAMIDVALQFYGNSSLSYPLTNASGSRLESISLIFNPEHLSSGDLVSSSQETVLKLENGSVLMDYGSGVISIGRGFLQANQWYHIFATKDNTNAILSMTFLPENGSTITVNAAVANTSQQYALFTETITIGNFYDGCLDRLIINNQQLSLLNPLEQSHISICGPRLPLESDREFDSSVWLFGAGSYLTVSSQQLEVLDLRFYFRTLDVSGLLLLIPSNNSIQYLAIYVLEGRLVVDFQLSTVDVLQLTTESLYNTGVWYEVSLLVDQLNVTMAVNDTEVILGSLSNVMNSVFSPPGTIIIGGLSTKYTALMDTLMTSLSIAGCVRSLQIDGLMINLNESESDRVDFGGCPETVASGVRFMGNGRAEFAVVNQEVHNVTFAFRTTQLAALLLHFDGLSISMFHTKLRVDLFNTFVLISEESGLNDNTMHTIVLVFSSSSNTSVMSLIVDGELSASLSYPKRAIIVDRIFVGGASLMSEIPVIESFRGCINFLVLNERELYFDNAEILIDISLYGCREVNQQPIRPPLPPPPPPPPPPPISPPPSASANVSVGLSGRNGSFIALRVSQDQILESFSIILDFQTISSEGVLLYMQGTDFFSLQLVSGHLLFSYDLGSGPVQIRSNGSYNDGMLHRAEITRSLRAGKLTVDNGLPESGESPGTFSFLNTNSGYLFIGGIPPEKTPFLRLPLEQLPLPVLACISAFAINGVFEDLSIPQASSGVGQCLPLYNNVVTLREDSYLLMRNEFYVGRQLNMSLDFRTDNCSGLLLYVASSIYPDHLLVELRNGCVALVFDNGPMREELEYCTDRQLCDGAWHSLIMSKNGQTGAISVDANSLQTVVSSCDICQNFLAVNTDDPLYVGGIPAMLRSRYTVETGSFKGCLGNLYIYREGRKPQVLLFSQALQHDNVEFDTCN